MQMPGRNGSTDEYRYGFNGMESDNEVKGEKNSYDFGARFHDPRVGRWLSRDPLEAKYPSVSPYVFSLNTPIAAHDPDGKKVIVGSEEALQIIKMTLSPEEAKYIEMNKNGKINKRKLKKGLRKIGVDKVGSNYSSLLTLVKDKEVVEVNLSQTYETANKGTQELPSDVVSDYRETWEYLYHGAADGSGTVEINNEEYDFESFKQYYDENELGFGIYVPGTQGITAVPDRLTVTDFDKKGREKSLAAGGNSYGEDGNIVVTINKKSAQTNELTGVKTMAHELYGHAYMAVIGKAWGHGTDRHKDNQELENRIDKSVDESKQNYEKHQSE